MPVDGASLCAHQTGELAEQLPDIILAFTDCLLQLLRGRLNPGNSDIASDTLHRVRDSFRQLTVSTFDARRDLHGCVTLFGGKLSQKVAIEAPVARYTL